MAKKNWPFGGEDEPDKEQRDEIGHPDGGVPPDFDSSPDQGIRHRGNPPAPAMDAPIPPQQLGTDELEQRQRAEEQRRMREQEEHENAQKQEKEKQEKEKKGEAD